MARPPTNRELRRLQKIWNPSRKYPDQHDWHWPKEVHLDTKDSNLDNCHFGAKGAILALTSQVHASQNHPEAP